MLSTNFETLKISAALPVQLCTTSTAVLHAVVQKKVKKRGTHSQNIFIALIFNFNFFKIFYFFYSMVQISISTTEIYCIRCNMQLVSIKA